MGGFRTISLSDTTYRKLRAEKRQGESFTEVIERLLAVRQPPPTKHLGAWKPITEEELEEIRDRLERIRHGTPTR
jgi:predicted CopG family antitoxin